MNKYDLDLVLDEGTSFAKIIEKIKKNSLILEFGPAAGRFTKYLKEHLKCKVHIVEIDKLDFENAMHYAEDGICSDIETMEWAQYFKNNKYDHIVFTDVLEHLRDPQKVFNACAGFIKDDGSILFSIPNAAHGDVIANIYNNDFKYTELGLMDNTHIHLFGYKNIIEMVEKSSLQLNDLEVVNKPLRSTEQNSEYSTDLLYMLFNEKEYSSVYQFVGECKKIGFYRSIQVQENFIRIYFSYGDEFTENNSMQKDVVKRNNVYEIILDKIDKKIKKLRVDPIEGKFIIIENVKTTGCSNIIHNGIEYKDRIIFNTLDPYFIVEVVDNEQITITFEMQICNICNLLDFYNKLDRIYDSIRSDLISKNSEYTMEISRQYNIIENFNNTIAELVKHNNAQHERITQQEKDIINLSTTIDDLNKHNNAQHEKMMQQDKEINKLYELINQYESKINEQQNIILSNEEENNILNQTINSKVKILDELKEKLDYNEQLCYRVIHSKSWKITKPLRYIAGKFKLNRGKNL